MSHPGISSFNTSTPPPPPPKQTVPSSSPSPYNSSRQHTPQASFSAPLPPPRPSSQSFAAPHSSSESFNPGQTYNSATPSNQQQDFEPGPPPQLELPQEGWLPEYARSLAKPDLEHLLRTPELLTALLHHPTHAHPALAASATPVQAQLEANIALAQQLNTLYKQVEQQREATGAQFLAVKGLEQQWRRTQERMEEALAPFGARELYSRLGAAITEGDAECEAIEQSFMEGEGVATEREVNEWIKKVRDGRRKVALRRERRARWDEGRVGGWR